MADPGGPDHAVLRAVDELLEALSRNEKRAAAVRARADVLRSSLSRGVALPEAVRVEDRPLIVELITEMMRELQEAGVELRRTEARALRHHGLTTEQIASLFGVTRQRVSALLRPPDEASSGQDRAEP